MGVSNGEGASVGEVEQRGAVGLSTPSYLSTTISSSSPVALLASLKF